MKQKHVGQLALCLIIFSGCGDSQGLQTEVNTLDATESSLTVARTVTAAQGQLRGRYIGIKAQADAPCPMPVGGNWRVSQLFGGPNSSEDLAPGLRPYCLYKQEKISIENQTSIPPELKRLLEQRQGNFLVAIEADHAGLAALADPLQADLGELFAKRFVEHAGRMERFPKAEFEKLSRVRLAALDTTPTLEPFQSPETAKAHSDHGLGITNILKQLTCDDKQTCTANLATRLTMPLRYERDGTLVDDQIFGGYFGTLGGLAEAIQAEVEAWQRAQRKTKDRQKLVLNLSLGWVGAFGGTGSPSGWPVDVRAVHAAMVDASCRGVLMIAAAGNTTGGPTDYTGPLYPGAWERLAAPSFKECWAATGQRPPQKRFFKTKEVLSVKGSLIYAASGIDATGGDLANARPGGRARLSSYGDHATVRGKNGMSPTLTGSSVSAAVVSATASTLWYYNPHLGPHDVMASIYNSAQSTGESANFCVAGSVCGESRRVSLCDALVKSCYEEAGLGACALPVVETCQPWVKSLPAGADLSTPVHASLATDVNVAAYSDPWSFEPQCGWRKLYDNAPGVGLVPCPDRQFYAPTAQPWVETQPGSNQCPNCAAVISSSFLYLHNIGWLSQFSHSTLNVFTSGFMSSYNLGALPNSSDAVISVDPSVLSGAQSVSLSSVRDGTAYTSPLYLAY